MPDKVRFTYEEMKVHLEGLGYELEIDGELDEVELMYIAIDHGFDWIPDEEVWEKE